MDHVEWNFSEAMMRKIGFRREWVTNSMKCVVGLISSKGQQ